MLIWLSCAKLRARPVDDEASKMRWRNKEQYERPKRVVRLCFWGKSSSFVNGRLFADLGSKQAKNWTNATVAQLVEQRIRNAQAVGSSPTSSSKTCVNTAFSQVFYFSEMNFKIQYAKKSHSFLWSEILFVYSIFSPRPSIDIYELILFLQCFIDFVEYKSIGIIAIITKDVYAAFFEMFKDCRGEYWMKSKNIFFLNNIAVTNIYFSFTLHSVLLLRWPLRRISMGLV